MAWQTSTVNPLSTTPAVDISKIVNDLAVLRGVIGGTADADVPSSWFSASGGAIGGNTTITGNLAFSGTARRILGDFYTATHASRTLFQANSNNAQTIVGAMPTGTATTAAFNVYNSSDPDNASLGTFRATASEVALDSTVLGAGVQKPLVLKVGSAAQLTMDGNNVTSAKPIVLPADATNPMEAATKQQLDAALSTIGYKGGSQTFTASGTFTVPDGVTKVFLTGCGGGGGGGGVAGSNKGAHYGGGGGSGYNVIRRAVTVAPGASITVTVGGGGGGGVAGYGGTGGTTSFGALLSISGGGGGAGTSTNSNAFNGDGGAGNWDGDGGSTTSNGGSSVFGRGALGGSPGASAAPNSGAGGGGGRTPLSGSARAGGAGGSGYLLVEW